MANQANDNERSTLILQWHTGFVDVNSVDVFNYRSKEVISPPKERERKLRNENEKEFDGSSSCVAVHHHHFHHHPATIINTGRRRDCRCIANNYSHRTIPTVERGSTYVYTRFKMYSKCITHEFRKTKSLSSLSRQHFLFTTTAMNNRKWQYTLVVHAFCNACLEHG